MRLGRGRRDVGSLYWLVLGAAITGTLADTARTPHACFTDRADESHLVGEWTTTGYKAPYDLCADVVGNERNGKCNDNLQSLQAGAGGVNLQHRSVLKQFHATSCTLPPFDAIGFARVIGHGATLWFLGDSITDQMVSSLVCLMHAGGFAVEGVRYGSIRCRILTDTRSQRSFRVCRAHQFSTEYVLRTLLRFNANAHHTAHQETVVVNFGLHSDETDYGEVGEALQAWRAHKAPRKLRLVWRDTSPQHFNERGGLFNRRTHNVSLPCLPIDDLRAAFAPYEQVTRMVDDAPDLHRLPIWPVTVPRFDAHNQRECTHFCLPGVPDEWNRLLYALLKAQPPPPNAVPDSSHLSAASYAEVSRKGDTLPTHANA